MVTALWLISICISQITNQMEAYYTCVHRPEPETLKLLYRTSYWVVVVRNILTMVITSLFSCLLYRKEQYSFANLGEAHEATTDFVLQDFNLLLNSFIPR